MHHDMFGPSLLAALLASHLVAATLAACLCAWLQHQLSGLCAGDSTVLRIAAVEVKGCVLGVAGTNRSALEAM